MKWIKYSRYTGEDFGIDSEDLLRALSDYLLQSGFNAQNMRFSEFNEHSLEELKRAIQQALENGQLFSDEQLEKMMEQLAGALRASRWRSSSTTWCRSWSTTATSRSKSRRAAEVRRQGRRRAAR